MSNRHSEFRALHQPGNPFILVNVWDQGTAKMMAHLGAEALATSSGAHAYTIGKCDMGGVSRDQALAHAEMIVASTNLPVSGDFENGFSHDPDGVAETVRLSAEVGLSGICIEDTNLPDVAPYAFDLAVEKIKAAVAAARALPQDFVLVARADGMMNSQYGVDEAIRRLKAFKAAGADCLYAPMPPSLADLERICREVDHPVNALTAGPFAKVSRAQYAAAGVARISIGAALQRAVHGLLYQAGKDMLGAGDFSVLSKALPRDVVEGFLDAN